MKKKIALLLSLLALLSATACGQAASDGESTTVTQTGTETISETEAVTETTDETETETETIEPETAPVAYAEVISLYTQLLTCKKNGEELPAVGEQTAITDAVYTAVGYAKDPSGMGYATQDINGDGTKELVFLSGDHYLYGLFTLDGDTPVALAIPYKGYGCVLAEGGLFYYLRTDTDEIYCIEELYDGALTGLSFGRSLDRENTTYHQIMNGVHTEITRTEYFTLTETYISHTWLSKCPIQNVNRGFRFISAIPSETSNGSSAPVANVTTYEDVLDMYQTIVSLFPTYTSNQYYKEGAYDHIYTFTDDETCRVFHSLLRAGVGARRTVPSSHYADSQRPYIEDGNKAYGYAYKDINGDGTDELILLSDECQIMAIFTMVNGKAVMLDAYWGDKQCFLANDGRIYVNWYSYFSSAVLGFRVYEISPEGTLATTLRLDYAMDDAAAGAFHYYKFVEGRRVLISREEGQSLRTTYDVSHDMAGHLYTKLYAELTFVPLFGTVTPDASLVDRIYTYLSIIGNSDFKITAASETSVSFSLPHTVYDNYTGAVLYEGTIEATATLSDGVYAFDNGTVKGRVEFGPCLIWIIVTDSNHEHIIPFARCFQHYPADI